LVRSEADKTKKFVKGLKTEIRSKLIPLQLKAYMQAVEKVLEIKADMLENSENRASEVSNFKHPRYQGPSNWRTTNLRIRDGMGSSVIPIQRNLNLGWR